MQETIPAIASSLQKTHEWLNRLTDIGPFDNPQQAYSGLRAVLHGLRDRLTVDEASDLASQLPMIIRGFYYEGWKPADAPNKHRTAEQFRDAVSASLPRNETIDLEHGIPAVFRLLEERADAGEIQDVREMLPADVRETYWQTSPT